MQIFRSVLYDTITQKSKRVETALKTSTNNMITVREAIRDALMEEMTLNDNVFLIGEEVGEYEGHIKFHKVY